MFNKYLNETTTSYNNVNTSFISWYVLNLVKKQDVLIVTSNLSEATSIYDNLSLLDSDNTFFYPLDDIISKHLLAESKDLVAERLLVLNELSKSNRPKILVTDITGALFKTESKDEYKDNIIRLEVGREIERDELKGKCSKLGYEGTPYVTNTGEFAVRGQVFDIWPLNNDNPVRITLDDETIESIKTFDPDEQVSLKSLENISILPLKESNKRSGSLLEYLDNPVIINVNNDQIKNRINIINEDIMGIDQVFNDYFVDPDTLKHYKSISMSMLTGTGGINVGISKLDNINLDKKATYVIGFNDDAERDKFSKNNTFDNILMTDINNIELDYINLILYPFTESFKYDGIYVIASKDLYNKPKTRVSNFKSKLVVGEHILKLEDLEIGAFVVHESHGIGRYEGIVAMKIGDLDKDYLKVKYAGKASLYVPVEKLEYLQKYNNVDGYIPKLNNLNGKEWAKTKAVISKRIGDMAKEIIKIAAIRKTNKREVYLSDKGLEDDFNNACSFLLTKDQEMSVNQILGDMDRDYPMDRLLCGDVGFGKTEVAFRAMFRAVVAGKQVAYLCPTTILSDQQYKKAVKRFEDFSVNIALVNRFTSKQEVKRIIDELELGNIDIIFGTHKLLNESFKFKSLGFLVIDEEQRFGVKHKEKILNMKANIDVLTLTATPIPRTLQMSLAGLKDLSMITTPPLNRYPVQTYVVEEDDALIRDIILREMARNGQVYFLYNRVETMEKVAIRIKSLIPEIKLAMIHGRMLKTEIERVMTEFVEGKYDVLLSTTIIEIGIDISNVNTLIIKDADMLGLSQLYQIRGRVGRGDRIAYAYLMYDANKIPNEDALKRLKVIKDFTALGSGLEIAKKDLSIRGAGDLLGKEQTGFVNALGIDLYLKMLQDEMKRLEGLEKADDKKVYEQPLLMINTTISNKYSSDELVKIEIHKLISTIFDVTTYNYVKETIIDQYGFIDEVVLNYMASVWFEKLARNMNVFDVRIKPKHIELRFENVDVINLRKINQKDILGIKNDRVVIKVDMNGLDIIALINYLEKIAK